MRLLQSLAVALTLGVVVTVSTSIPAAAATLATPGIEFLDNSPSYISLTVTGAGTLGTPNGFTVEWMPKADFVLYGWPADYLTPEYVNYRNCTFNGAPVFNLTPGVPDFLLGPNVSVRIVLGELFDEMGCDYLGPYTAYTDELNPETQYAIRIRAEGGPGGDASLNSATLFLSSGTHEVCRFTLGYWKNHPTAWPTLSLTLGTNTYNQAQLISILSQPSLGNGLTILCHQLIAAKLNALLATPTPSIVSAIAAANTMVGSLIPPPLTGSGSLSSSSVNALSTQLDNFNNGKTGGDNCTTPVGATTWGRLKTLYR